MSSAPALPASSLRRRLLGLAVALALAATVMLAVPGLRDVLVAIGDMRPGWVAVALALEVASCVSYVVVFRLAFEPLAPDAARGAAWSVMGSGALLPGGGVGGLAIGGWLLRVAGMPLESVLARASWVFCLTTVASGVVLVVAGTLLAAGLVAGPHGALLTVLPVLAAAAAVGALFALPALVRRGLAGRPAGPARELVAGIGLTAASLRRPRPRLLGACGYVLFDIGALWATFAALGASPPPAALAVAYLIGYLANAIPVPAGAGALDAGLIGALVLYGMPVQTTTAAVLVYHAIVFWVPGAGGLVGYLRLRRRLADQSSPTPGRLTKPWLTLTLRPPSRRLSSTPG